MRTLPFLLIDAALVLVFAALGNRAHDSGLSPADLISTAWPFLVGLALGWAASGSWRRPHSLWPHGVILLAVTAVVGMLLRQLFTDGGAQFSFVLVATGTLCLLLLGRRLAALITLRLRAHPTRA